MKKRLGFVSNSSSSSFIVIGREINQDEINEENVNDIVFESIIDGEYGQLGGEFDSMEMFNAYKEFVENKKDSHHDTSYYLAKVRSFEYAGEIDINPTDIEEGSKAYFGTCDQFVISCLNDMEEAVTWYNDEY